MHKSKYFDMATQVAMDKLMPKPIQITTSMQGGGGLTGLGDRPLSSGYGRPIPRTIYRYNGGGFGYTEDDVAMMQAANGAYTYGGDLQDDPSITPTPIQLDMGTGKAKPPTGLPLQDDPPPTPTPIQLDMGRGRTGLTQKGLLNYFGVPFHLERPTPRQVYTPKNFQTPRQEYSPINFQPLPIAPTIFPKDPEEREIGVVQEYVNKVLKSADKPLIDSTTAKLIYNSPAGFLQSVHNKGYYGSKAKEIEVPEVILAASTDQRRRRADALRKKGGGGLSSIKKSININGQPHSLAWINPDEASALRAMGGSGKPGPGGIPSYQWEFTAPSEQEWVEAWDFGGDPAIPAPSYDPWPEERAEIIKSSGTGEGRSKLDPRLDPVIARTMKTGEPPKLSYVRQIHQDVQDTLKGMDPSKRKGQNERELFVKTLQEQFPDLTKQFDIEGFAKDYNPFLPGAIPIKFLGGLMGWLRGKTSPVVATIMVHGEKKNVHADGSISEIRAGDQTTEDADLYKKDKPIEVAKGISEPTTTTAKGPMQTYQEGLTSIESNQGLINRFHILKEQYPYLSTEEIMKMLGEDINEIDISEIDINV